MKQLTNIEELERERLKGKLEWHLHLYYHQEVNNEQQEGKIINLATDYLELTGEKYRRMFI